MGKGRVFIQRLVDEELLTAGALPGLPILELAGDRRVLIENHLGVMEYGRNRITVKVGYGQVSVLGDCLEIMRMTKQQLIICGRIGGITLQRRGKP